MLADHVCQEFGKDMQWGGGGGFALLCDIWDLSKKDLNAWGDLTSGSTNHRRHFSLTFLVVDVGCHPEGL